MRRLIKYVRRAAQKASFCFLACGVQTTVQATQLYEVITCDMYSIIFDSHISHVSNHVSNCIKP
jgi:hypothetical protein